jgi:cysteine synthase A
LSVSLAIIENLDGFVVQMVMRRPQVKMPESTSAIVSNLLTKSTRPGSCFVGNNPACRLLCHSACMVMLSEIQKRIKGISSLICNTPLLEIAYQYKGQDRLLYAKAEHLNLTGSIKDRMAFYILQQAYRRGALQAGATIVEASSGNTGIAFSAIGQALGHRVVIFMPEWMSEERKNLIRALGARIRLVSREEGGFVGSIQLAEEYASNAEAAFLPRQFSNEDNVQAHYLTTGAEIWWQLQIRNIRPAAFVAGVGTGGTIMGIGKLLKEKYPDVRIHPLEPSNSRILTAGHKTGHHRIQGISDEFVPPILRMSEIDEVISVDDGDAIIMAQKLASEIGLGVGISSGANFVGAVMAQNQSDDNACVVTVFPDDNKKYLTTDLLNIEPVREGFISSDVKLIGFRAFKRVCYTCWDEDEFNDPNLSFDFFP